MDESAETSGMTAEAALSIPEGRVIGVLPRALTSKEKAKAKWSIGVSSGEGRGEQVVKDEDSYDGRIELEIVDDMHTVSISC